jgi:hypothetical protein
MRHLTILWYTMTQVSDYSSRSFTPPAGRFPYIQIEDIMLIQSRQISKFQRFGRGLTDLSLREWREALFRYPAVLPMRVAAGDPSSDSRRTEYLEYTACIS